MNTLYQNVDINRLDYIVTEHFDPGELIDLELFVDRVPNLPELSALADTLNKQGLDVRKCGMSGPNILTLQFVRPNRPTGYAQIPVAVVIIGALAAIGVVSYIIVRIGQAVASTVPDLIKIAAVVGGALLVIWFASKQQKRTK